MKLNDYKCKYCKTIIRDQVEPPICCGEPMQKLYVPNPVMWKTPGFTKPRPKDGE